MSDMADKARESRSIAESFVEADTSLNFAANRHYYSLYQIANAFNESPNGEDYKKQGNQSYHMFTRHIVDKALSTKRYLLWTLDELRDLRVQADYYPGDIERSDLDDSLLDEVKELYEYFENKIPRTV